MKAFVVDTNVAVVANGGAPQTGPQCTLSCCKALRTAIDGIVVVDANYLILREYIRAVGVQGQPGVGHKFVKWVFDNQAVGSRCEQVALTLRANQPGEFTEFPDDEELAGFDRSDRKFAAVALGSHHDPQILNAVDSDWWLFRKPLNKHGLQIRFLCPEQFDSAP